jgi:hypothetical protein
MDMPRRMIVQKMIPLLALAWLPACASEELPQDPPGSTLRTPTPYEPAPAERPTPALDAEAVLAALPAALELLTTLDPQHHRALYESFREDADESCPVVEEHLEDGSSVSDLWLGNCTTSGGTHFLGEVHFTTYTGRDNGDGTLSDGFALYSGFSEASIVRADGSLFRMGGRLEVDVARAVDGSASLAQVRLDGSFASDPASAGGDPWLGGERRGVLSLIGQASTGGARSLRVEAGLSLGEGGAFDAVASGAIAFGASNGCASEPAGGLGVRDPAGTWYDVRFDANPPDDETPAGVCDGCGVVLAAGHAIGAACPPVDAFAGLLAFEETPW